MRRLLSSVGASAALLVPLLLSMQSGAQAYPRLLVDDKRCAVPLEVR